MQVFIHKIAVRAAFFVYFFAARTSILLFYGSYLFLESFPGLGEADATDSTGVGIAVAERDGAERPFGAVLVIGKCRAERSLSTMRRGTDI